MRLPMRQVVNVGNGLCRQKTFELLVGTEQENRMRILIERLTGLERIHDHTGVNDNSHIWLNLSVFASSKVMSAGRIPNRDLAMSTLS